MTDRIHPSVPDHASLPLSILPPEDADEAFCPVHGEMNKKELMMKYDDELWVTKEDLSGFVCDHCIRELAQTLGTSYSKALAAYSLKAFRDEETDEMTDDFYMVFTKASDTNG